MKTKSESSSLSFTIIEINWNIDVCEQISIQLFESKVNIMHSIVMRNSNLLTAFHTQTHATLLHNNGTVTYTMHSLCAMILT